MKKIHSIDIDVYVLLNPTDEFYEDEKLEVYFTDDLKIEYYWLMGKKLSTIDYLTDSNPYLDEIIHEAIENYLENCEPEPYMEDDCE